MKALEFLNLYCTLMEGKFYQYRKGCLIIISQEQEDIWSALLEILPTTGEFSIDLFMFPWTLLRTP
jgi:hypothetical protein